MLELIIDPNRQFIRLSCSCCGQVRDIGIDKSEIDKDKLTVSIGDIPEPDPSEPAEWYMEACHVVK